MRLVKTETRTKIFFFVLKGFEEELRKREHEHRKKMDECNATVLAHEMKVWI